MSRKETLLLGDRRPDERVWTIGSEAGKVLKPCLKKIVSMRGDFVF